MYRLACLALLLGLSLTIDAKRRDCHQTLDGSFGMIFNRTDEIASETQNEVTSEGMATLCGLVDELNEMVDSLTCRENMLQILGEGCRKKYLIEKITQLMNAVVDTQTIVSELSSKIKDSELVVSCYLDDVIGKIIATISEAPKIVKKLRKEIKLDI